MSKYELRGKETKEVYEMIKRLREPVSIREVRASADVNYNTIRGEVQRLLRQGLIERITLWLNYVTFIDSASKLHVNSCRIRS